MIISIRRSPVLIGALTILELKQDEVVRVRRISRPRPGATAPDEPHEIAFAGATAFARAVAALSPDARPEHELSPGAISTRVGPEPSATVPASPPDPPTPSPNDAREWLSTTEAAARLGVDRSTLDAMVRRAPRSLPGGPVHVGDGRKRRHLRWSADTLSTWADALRTYDADRGRRRR